MRRTADDDGDAAEGDGGDEVAEDREKPAVQMRGRSQGGGGRRVAPTVCAANDEEAVDAVVEKALPNGDLYTGGFAGSAPHGRGKYLWVDGCMYEGEWRRGKAAGKGKFSWPSGATFEGEFRSGRMEGFGTFIGADGNTYRGQWVADRKHGFGSKSYANGDYYEGMWRRNLQEGHGRYIWRNGNQYIGEWRGGVINGRGALIWANGNRYDGQWENGVPKGSGVFTWPDGSCYVGSWSHGEPMALNGTFYPAPTTARKETPGKRSSFFHLDDELGAPLTPLVPFSGKLASIDGGAPGRGSSAAEKSFPRICIWELDGEAGDITCDIIDTLEASMLYRDASTFDQSSATLIGTVQQRQNPCCLSTHEVKKPAQLRELRPSDFDPMEKYWMRFPPEGSKITPPHLSVEFRWKDYCPMVLIRMLPSYYRHVCQYANSLVTRFYGVHCVKPNGGQKDYDITKKLEHAYKSLQADPNSISAVDPKLYSRRTEMVGSKDFADDAGKQTLHLMDLCVKLRI
ncbi:hypothetical protein BHE74_00050844 [Ensete ventricosum]|nr:hypothetical protein BHE74_00050844 [Ensete ventricosum]